MAIAGLYSTVGHIPFNTILLNNGNNYNSANGRFTAPIAGNYLFSFKALNENTNGTRVAAYIMKNDVQYMGLFGPTGYGDMLTGTCVMPMNAGDWATIYLRLGGVYGGGVGYFAANGEMDFCIALRTAVLKDQQLYIQAGGGVVYDSDPEAEFQETVNKSRALRRAAEDAGLFARRGNG